MTDLTSNKTGLVTGGTGFMATWCIVDLIQRGFNVRTTVRNQSRGSSGSVCRWCFDDRLTFFGADLTKDEGFLN